MWPKIDNSSISMVEFIITSIFKRFDQKNHFFRAVFLVQIQWFGTGARYDLEILHQCGKKVKTKIERVTKAISYVCRSYMGKTGRGPFPLHLPSLPHPE